MVLIINLIAAIVLFFIPIRKYYQSEIITQHPLYKYMDIGISFELYFLVYSVLTAMVFLGPLSLFKYGYWIIFLIILSLNRLEFRFGAIVNTYILFIFWALLSAVFYSTVKFQAGMMLMKYVLPLFYLWLGYTAINDEVDFLYFLKKVAIGMCIYALIIGGFSAKFLSPLYGFLNFTSGALFISYASLADYYSGLIAVPVVLFLITRRKIWLWATAWVILSTILETVRTGLGGIFLACSFLFLAIYHFKAVPWIISLCIAAVSIVFIVPSFHEKMFVEEDVTFDEISVEDMNFETIKNNSREYVWDLNMENFYYPSPITGSGLGESVEFTKGLESIKLIHSDYVQILCDMGLIGIILFGFFVITLIYEVLNTVWRPDSPYLLKLTGGMALASAAGVFFSMAFDNVVAYAQQSFVLPFIFIGIYLKVKDLGVVD